MSDNKKYYYMRLKENFFDDDNMLILESMPDGYLYCNILLKLYLRSLKDNGRLMLNGRIPYNPQMLATVTRHQIGTVERALNIFKELGLVEVLDNGAIYMMDIQNYIGKSSSEADRQREYQNRLKSEKELGNALPEESCKESCKKSNRKSTPELELEKEIELDKEIEKEREDKKASSRFIPPTLEEVSAFIAENNYRVNAEKFIDYYNANGWMVGKTKMKDWKAAVRNWHRNEREVPKQTGKVQQKFKPEGRDLSFLEV